MTASNTNMMSNRALHSSYNIVKANSYADVGINETRNSFTVGAVNSVIPEGGNVVLKVPPAVAVQAPPAKRKRRMWCWCFSGAE